MTEYVNNSQLDPKLFWNDCLAEIKNYIPDRTFETWFKPLKANKINDDELQLMVPNKFFKEWIETNYRELIQNTVKKITEKSVTLHYLISKQEQSSHTNLPISYEKESLIPKKEEHNNNTQFQLNHRYTFDTFVEGPYNQFAKVASHSVADSLGNTAFNPLLIYGGSGLGKTHLLQAIGNKVRSKYPEKTVIYVSSEKFMVDYISALQNNKIADFTKKYRYCDVLLMDDIQFLQAKEGTQEQFFHTFNDLYQAGKQIVITSDRTPKELKGVEERLVSRFLWGLTVDIQPPDFETRIAILKKKALIENLEIPDDVIEFIAKNITNNVRELESATTKIFAYSSLTHLDISISLAKKVIKDILGVKKSSIISVEHILKSVAKFYYISENDIISKNRTKVIALARQIIMYLSREMSGDSLKSIGLRIGGRDHTTVIHACSSIAEKLKKDPIFKKEINTIRNQIELFTFD